MHQEFDPRDLEPALPTKSDSPVRSKVAPIMIALVALAGFGGVVWYAYDQGVRQSGPPGVTPLIKADTSPTKVRPEQPGGMDVPHQDKLVLNTLAGGKSDAPPVERLLPPPETPLPRPTAGAAAATPTPAPAGAPAPVANAPSVPPKIGPAPITAPAAPAAATTPATPAAPPAHAPTQIAAAPAPATVAPAPKPADKSPSAPAKVTPAAAPGSGFKVQLVSVKQQGETAQEWARLQHSFPELVPLHMSVMRVDLGDKGVWYRIYGGPLADAAAAGQLCSALKAKNQGCVVVKP